MSERDARRKILLLKGTLYRLEILRAKQTLRDAADSQLLIRGLPGMLKSLLSKHRVALLTSVLPSLLGRGRLARMIRRAVLAAGGVTAAWAWLNRGKGNGDGPPGP
jgi:hypothetical protein